MKFRAFVSMIVLPVFLAGVIGCGDDPSVKPKAGKGALSGEQDKTVEKQKPIVE
jgi:hypothetical protein